MVRFVCAVALTLALGSPATAGECPKAEYQARLAALPPEKGPESVGRALEALLATAKGQEDACKDQLVLLFREHYFCALATYGDTLDYDAMTEKDEAKWNSLLAPAGWRLATTEGNYYIAERSGWAEKQLKEALSPGYARYLELRSKEIAQGFSEDAGLLISWEELRVRIVTWEAFLAQYPEFPEKCAIQDYQDTYLRVYLTGMDNSRVFDFDGNRLEPAVKKSYEAFLKENQKSAYFQLISDYYNYLKKNDFVQPQDLNDFLAKKGYKSFLATQPPTY